jgi:hypothetical protein
MTLIFILLGWFIISILWGFIPLVEPLRLAAIANPARRKTITAGSAALAFATGVLLLAWISCYTLLVISVVESHMDSQLMQGSAQSEAGANMVFASNEILLRPLFPGAVCINSSPVVCALADRALTFGSPLGMLPIISPAALLPALVAALICWKLTLPPRPVSPDML